MLLFYGNKLCAFCLCYFTCFAVSFLWETSQSEAPKQCIMDKMWTLQNSASVNVMTIGKQTHFRNAELMSCILNVCVCVCVAFNVSRQLNCLRYIHCLCVFFSFFLWMKVTGWFGHCLRVLFGTLCFCFSSTHSLTRFESLSVVNSSMDYLLFLQLKCI